MEDKQISLALLSKSRKIIPLYFGDGEAWQTNIKLPVLVLRNTSDRSSLEIAGISVIGRAAGKTLVTLQHGGDINDTIAGANQLLNRLTRKPATQWRAYNLGMLFGEVSAPQAPFEEHNHLEPGTALCVRLQDFLSFHYIGSQKIDELACRLTLAAGEGESDVEIPIPLTPYQCKGDYIFPIKGPAVATGTPWNPVMGHRMATSQEFAFDVVDFRRDAQGGFVLSSPPGSSRVEDYFLYEREVLAIADGIVAAAGNQWPNEWVMNPLDYSEERIVELTQKLLDDGVAFDHAILGNYVVIDHRNGEFSLYAHMSQGTVSVAPGDQVRQGQPIGKVGNTSNSDFPHLHFHLMDSADFQTANGLPVMFRNVPNGQPPMADFKEANSLLYSDYLFVNT